MIEALLPTGVAVAEAFGPPEEARLDPVERPLVAAAVPRRQAEFASGRECARRALGELGFAAMPILHGDHGEPRWPTGAVGSITHCAGYRGAAVALTHTAGSLGIDAEPALPLPGGILTTIARPSELRNVRDLFTSAPKMPWDRLLFSAKESAYKAWFPNGRRVLGYDEVEVSIINTGDFRAALLPRDAGGDEPPPAAAEYLGRWCVNGGLVLTAVLVPASVTSHPERSTPTNRG